MDLREPSRAVPLHLRYSTRKSFLRCGQMPMNLFRPREAICRAHRDHCARPNIQRSGSIRLQGKKHGIRVGDRPSPPEGSAEVRATTRLDAIPCRWLSVIQVNAASSRLASCTGTKSRLRRRRPLSYSVRSANSGSILAARRAGMNPATTAAADSTTTAAVRLRGS